MKHDRMHLLADMPLQQELVDSSPARMCTTVELGGV